MTGAELIGRHTWARFAQKADARIGGPRRVRFARCYLYELLTGGNLHLAPAPYRMESGFERIDYHDFVASLPQGLVDVLHHHAERLLADAGITGEPLQWQPPINWVTITDWPGADPDRTDPQPIHQALRGWRAPQAQVAASLGISTEHLRYVVRQHPRPRPAYPTRRVLIAPTSDGRPAPTYGGPNAISLDPAWLHHEYVTWRRSLPDIAAELGCRVANLKKFAHENGIPVRRRSGPEGFAHLDAPGVHPSQVPDPLRSVLVGRDARQRLSRFLVLAEHPSLTQAARAIGAHQSTLTQQLQQLERACGGLLLHRHPATPICRPADAPRRTTTSPGTRPPPNNLDMTRTDHDRRNRHEQCQSQSPERSIRNDLPGSDRQERCQTDTFRESLHCGGCARQRARAGVGGVALCEVTSAARSRPSWYSPRRCCWS